MSNREIATEVLSGYVLDRGHAPIAREMLKDAITAALDAKTPPPGHILDDGGVVRKVLPPTDGPRWYLTEDGCVVPNTSAMVYAYEMAPGCKFTGKIITMKYLTWFSTRWDDFLPPCWNRNAPDGKWGCYSTRELAEAARAKA